MAKEEVTAPTTSVWAGRAFLITPFVVAGIVLLPPIFIRPLTLEPWLHTLTAWTILAAVPGALVFPMNYSRVPWWKSRLGRAVMMMATSITMLVTFAAIRVLTAWPDVALAFAGERIEVDFMRFAVYAYMFLAIYYKTAALWTVSRKGSDLHTDDHEARQLHSDEEEKSSANSSG